MLSDTESLMLPDGLDDPNQHQEAIGSQGRDADSLRHQLYLMLVIRKVEEFIGDMVTAGVVKCPAHLGIGQEAVPVGLSRWLRPTDRVFGAHRSHSHFLALGASVTQLFAEILGRVTGASRGMGGSMHIYSHEHGFLGSVPIVAASVPIATGAGLAAKMDGRGDVAISYFGDGAIEEGAVHESLNLASVMQLPVIFVCENNLFASHMHIDIRQPANSTARLARAHGIPAYTVDGNNVMTMTDIAQEAIQRGREGGGPSFIEAVTYRWRGHVGPREDLDVGVRRSDDLKIWKKRDPIARLVNGLFAADMLSPQDYEDLQARVECEVQDAWQKAEDSPFPEPAALLDWVYAP